MFKKVISFILLTFLNLPSLKANPYLMTHERFVHLSEKEKQELIILTMEMLVEMESKYQYQVSYHDYREKLQRLAQLLLINSAHANEQTPKSWQQYAKNFIDNLAGTKGDKCFYAGWISKLYGGLCVHPGRIKEKDSPEKLSYEEFVGDCPPHTISCSPAFFGFKNKAEKSLFCVDASVKATKNASHNCMRMALDIDPQAGADSKSTRLHDIMINLEGNPGTVNKIHEYAMKACVCDEDPGQGMSKAYARRIKPHRTCYAMMEMMGATLTCDYPTKLPIDLGFFEEIKKHTEEENNHKTKKQTMALDYYYKAFLRDIKKKTAYKEICLGQPKPIPEPPKVIEYECGKIEYAKDCKLAQGQTPEIKNLNCEAYYFTKEEPDKRTVFSLTGAPGAVAEHKFKINEVESTVKCNLPLPPDAPLTESTCAIEHSGEDTISAVAQFTPQGEDKAIKYVWTDKEESAEKVEYILEKGKELTIGLSIEVQRGQETYTISCQSVTKTAPAAPERPTISVSAGEETATEQTAEAEVGGENLEGWNLVWTTKGKGAPKKSTKPKSSMDRVIAKDGDAEETKLEEEEKPREGEAAKAGVTPHTVARGAKEYQICAHLNRDSEDIQGGCITVAALKDRPLPKVEEKKEKRYYPPATPQMPPPQAPPRPDSSFSVQGTL